MIGHKMHGFIIIKVSIKMEFIKKFRKESN